MIQLKKFSNITAFFAHRDDVVLKNSSEKLHEMTFRKLVSKSKQCCCPSFVRFHKAACPVYLTVSRCDDLVPSAYTAFSLPPTEMNRHHYSLYVHNCRLVFLLRRDFTQVDTFRPAEFHWKLEQVKCCDALGHIEQIG